MSITQKEIDRGWKKIVAQHSSLKNIDIQVGLFGSGNDPKQNPAYLGLIQEKGAEIRITPRMRGFLRRIGIFVKNDTLHIIIPKRSFTANAFDGHKDELIQFIVTEYRKVIDGKETLRKMIDRIGVKHEGQIKKSFTEFTYAPNHPVTIERKGSSRPLIGGKQGSGQLRGSVKYKVVGK